MYAVACGTLDTEIWSRRRPIHGD